MADFNLHIEDLIEKEGGYVLHKVKHDRGGLTYAGISRKHNPKWAGWSYIDLKDTPPTELIHEFYKTNYWDRIQGDHVVDFDKVELLFSCAVLSGPIVSAVIAQAAARVKVDGVFGPRTLQAINEMSTREFELAFALARINRYISIVCNNPSQLKFLNGWRNRVNRELKS